MSFLVTRGLGGNAASMISLGFFDTASSIIKGGSRFVKETYLEIQDHLKISVNLISISGKELTQPIFNKVSKVFKTNSDIVLRVLPKTLIVRKSKKIKVTAKLRKDDNEYNRFIT